MKELEKLNESLKKAGEALNVVSNQVIISSLEKGLEDKQCQIEEMLHHIDCLNADLAEARDNKIQLPTDPIKVATMLIDATEKRENCMNGKEYDKPMYEKWQLEQIARHLLVYCNNSEDE